jgi:KipI family sensor histidine kinase inhibitor
LPEIRLLPCGERAVLVELEDLDAVLGLHDALRADAPAGVTELVPAARTLLVAFDPGATDAGRLRDALRAVEFSPGAQEEGPLVEIPVIYDGEDLDDVAAHSGLTRDEVAAAHAGGRYIVAFCGFAPGFAYLAGLDERLHVPRRDSPRKQVPAGAVAIADRFSAVYPRPSPGGWQLIGRTDLTLWDTERDPPARLVPGTRVRFAEASETVMSAKREAG